MRILIACILFIVVAYCRGQNSGDIMYGQEIDKDLAFNTVKAARITHSKTPVSVWLFSNWQTLNRGGVDVEGSWTDNTLLQVEFDNIGITLSNNQITLPAGIYHAHMSFCNYSNNDPSGFRNLWIALRLWNVTDGQELVRTPATTNPDLSRKVYGSGLFQITEPKTIEFQYYSTGEGVDINWNLGYYDFESAVKSPIMYSWLNLIKLDR